MPLAGKEPFFLGCRDKTAAVSAYAVNENNPLTTVVNGLHGVERRRIELPTSALRTQRSPN